MSVSSIKAYFPIGIDFPKELAELCSWFEDYGYPISGYFTLYANEHNVIERWFGTDTVNDRFGVFGSGPDGSLYCIWRQDNGQQPIVHLGSEGQNNFVLAGNMLDFIRLLAIGYAEIGFADLGLPPNTEDVNPKFKEWVRGFFQVEIPTIGAEIVQPALTQFDDFQLWIDKVIAEDFEV